jgi:hypothetical protein
MTRLIKSLYILAFACVFLACSKDNETDPATDDPAFTLSFKESGEVMQLPAGLINSSNSMALSVKSWVLLANNSLTGMFSFLEIPFGAERSNTPIFINGESPSANTKFWVYSRTHQGSTMVYQVSEANDKYTWEVLVNSSTNPTFKRMMFAEEKKDKSLGKFLLYNWEAENPAEVIQSYDWVRTGNLLDFKMEIPGTLHHFKVNPQTKAGEVKRFINEELIQEIIWNNMGSGNWKNYENGQISEQGSW